MSLPTIARMHRPTVAHMDRRTFFASLAGFAALTQLRAAAPTAPNAPPTLPPAAAPAAALEWDFTAEDYDAFQARTKSIAPLPGDPTRA